MKDTEGELVKWIGAMTNLHTRKTFSESLEKLVAERTKELARSNEDLQQFAHVASHDLKKPLRKVMGFNNCLKIESENQPPAIALAHLPKLKLQPFAYNQ